MELNWREKESDLRTDRKVRDVWEKEGCWEAQLKKPRASE